MDDDDCSSISCCKVCFATEVLDIENTDRADLLSLEHSCAEQVCRACLKKWFEACECTGKHYPTCPQCRDVIGPADCRMVLGREFNPTKPKSIATIDDFTLLFLQENNIKKCPNCSVWIEKEPETCDMMECLCGYRFCFECGIANAECECDDANHWFWDNIRGNDSTNEKLLVAGESDLENFKAFLQEREENQSLDYSDEEFEHVQRHEQWRFLLFASLWSEDYFSASSAFEKVVEIENGELPENLVPQLLRLVRKLSRPEVDKLFPGLPCPKPWIQSENRS